MKYIAVTVVSIIVISNILEISFAKRIKRNVGDKQNTNNFGPDFVVLNPGSVKKEKEAKAIDYKAALNEAKGQDQEDKNHFTDIGQYIINRAGSKVEENNHSGTAEQQENSDLKKEPNSMGQEAANMVGTHIILPSEHIVTSQIFRPFSPVDQIMKFANTFFYKTPKDENLLENDDSLPLEIISSDSPTSNLLFHSPTFAIAEIATGIQNSKGSNTQNKDIADLFESSFHNPSNADVEVFCPLHGNMKDLNNFEVHICKCQREPLKSNK